MGGITLWFIVGWGIKNRHYPIAPAGLLPGNWSFARRALYKIFIHLPENLYSIY
jgi:hypothetical protein